MCLQYQIPSKSVQQAVLDLQHPEEWTDTIHHACAQPMRVVHRTHEKQCFSSLFFNIYHQI